jgi:putative nucleotidyltransferase with HDIG domain
MKILFIDDDLNVLEGLKRMLVPMVDSMQMEFFDQPAQALESIKASPCDLVVCDLQMPGLNGVQLLEKIKTARPDTIRYILTGMIDHPLHHAALRLAHQVIAKPCRPELLRELIQRAARLKHQLDQSELAAVLPRIQALPSMPTSYQRVLDYLASPTASCRGLSRAIETDVAMCARIMQLANSAYYGRPGKVHNLIQAVIYLGVKTVEAMILHEGVFQMISPALAERFCLAGLENHCMRVGMLARRISSSLALPPELLEQASMAGILHDTGKIAMICEFTDRFEQALTLSRDGGMELSEAEKHVCGFSHAELGAALLNLWSMPADIIETAAFHHNPLLNTPSEPSGHSMSLADIVYMADCIDHYYCSGSCDGSTCTVNQSYLKNYGLAEQYCLWEADHRVAMQQEPAYA